MYNHAVSGQVRATKLFIPVLQPTIISAPSIETVIVKVINKLTQVQDKFVLILDDYHILDLERVE